MTLDLHKMLDFWGVNILEERKKEKIKEITIKQRKKYINTNPALRVPPAETRLTVYRWIDITRRAGVLPPRKVILERLYLAEIRGY